MKCPEDNQFWSPREARLGSSPARWRRRRFQRAWHTRGPAGGRRPSSGSYSSARSRCSSDSTARWFGLCRSSSSCAMGLKVCWGEEVKTTVPRALSPCYHAPALVRCMPSRFPPGFPAAAPRRPAREHAPCPLHHPIHDPTGTPPSRPLLPAWVGVRPVTTVTGGGSDRSEAPPVTADDFLYINDILHSRLRPQQVRSTPLPASATHAHTNACRACTP